MLIMTSANCNLPIEAADKPWGYYWTYDSEKSWKLKKLVIYPKQMTSLQSHKHRNELWFVAEGSIDVDFSDGYVSRKKKGDYLQIHKGTKHRIINPGVKNAVVIEIQHGKKCEEEDIIRYEDKYGRVRE